MLRQAQHERYCEQYWGVPTIGHSGATSRLSHQLVPNSTATALLLEVALLGQHPEVLFQRVATRAGQPDDVAHRDLALFARELDDPY